MNVKVLGTAASEGIPAMFCSCDVCTGARSLKGKDLRSRSQFLINDDVLVDFGDDTYCHSLDYGVNLSKVKYLLITHYHVDHYNPLNFRYRGHYYTNKMDEPVMYVYSPPNVQVMYNDCEIRPEVRANIQFIKTSEFTPVKADPYVIYPMLAPHLREAEAGLGIKCFIYVLEKAGKRVLFGTDSGYYSDEIFDYLKNMRLDLVFLDCTHGQKSKGLKNPHMGLPENMMIKEKFLQNGTADKNTIFVSTHFSHNSGGLHDELSKIAEQHGFLIAFDGMQFKI